MYTHIATTHGYYIEQSWLSFQLLLLVWIAYLVRRQFLAAALWALAAKLLFGMIPPFLLEVALIILATASGRIGVFLLCVCVCVCVCVSVGGFLLELPNCTWNHFVVYTLSSDQPSLRDL